MKAGRGLPALVAMLAAGALSAPPAHAGSYDVYSCTIDGAYFPNNAWVAGNNPAGNAAYGVDASCPKSGHPIAVSLAANTAFPNGTYAGRWLYAPPQAAITDFKISLRHYWFAPPLPNYPTERTYTLASFGDVVYSGTGLFRQADQDALAGEGHWYSYRGAHQSGAADTGAITLTRAASKRATAAPNAAYLTLSAGCYTDDGSACSLGTDGAGNVGTAFLQIFGSRVTITDGIAPALGAPVAGQGLLAPGTRSGDEPVTFSASYNVGIRRAELVDVTDATNPAVVASEDYNDTASDARTRCDFTRPRPCPDLTKEAIAAPTAIAGRRTLLLRVTDAAGNQTVSPPFAISARGPVNGSGGGDGARLIAGFPGHTFRGRGKARRRVGVLRPTKTVGWGHGATVRGVLRNASGQPVAGAQLRLLVRELRSARSTSIVAPSPRPLMAASRRYPARFLAALPHRLPGLSRRRPPDRQVRRNLQHQGADHHPRAAPRALARDRALPREPARPAAAAPRRDARAPGPPAGPRLAHGQDHAQPQGRRLLDALSLQLGERAICFSPTSAAQRQLSLRARHEQGRED